MLKLPKARPGNEWIEWNGGECPVPVGTKVDTIYRDGYKNEMWIGWLGFSQNIWSHLNDEGDIVAYRLSWVRHRGGKHPGKPGDKFVVRFRNGRVVKVFIMDNDRDNNIMWRHFNNRYDIMAYKPVL